MTILITRPRHDKATNYLFFWSQLVVDLVKRKSLRLLDLKAEKANRKLLYQYCRKFKPALFFLNGHGSVDLIFGHENQVLISSKEKLSNFKGSLFYCRCCDAAVELGPALVKSGATGFIGYKRKFVIGYMPEYISHPLRDPLAKKFLEPSNLVPISLIKGNSLIIAFRKSQVVMRSNLRKMLSSDAPLEERYHAQFLWSNIRSQTILGDPEAVI